MVVLALRFTLVVGRLMTVEVKVVEVILFFADIHATTLSFT